MLTTSYAGWLQLGWLHHFFLHIYGPSIFLKTSMQAYNSTLLMRLRSYCHSRRFCVLRSTLVYQSLLFIVSSLPIAVLFIPVCSVTTTASPICSTASQCLYNNTVLCNYSHIYNLEFFFYLLLIFLFFFYIFLLCCVVFCVLHSCRTMNYCLCELPILTAENVNVHVRTLE